MDNRFNKRALNQEFLEDLLDGPLTPILEHVKKDDTLCMELRGTYVDIYYRGGALLTIREIGNGGYCISFNEKYSEKCEDDTRTDDAREARGTCLTALDAVREVSAHKEAMDFYFAKHPKTEREFQQIILRENNNLGTVSDSTDYFILDMEYAINHCNGQNDSLSARFDMLAFKWESKGHVRKHTENLPITFIEVKYGDGAMNSGEDCKLPGIRKHINDYIKIRKDDSMLQALARDMACVFRQKHKLGLVSCYPDKEDIDLTLDPENVELLFVLANHDPEKSRLLREIKTAMSELQGTEDEKYLSEIKIARSSLMGYGLYSYDKNGNDRFYSL